MHVRSNVKYEREFVKVNYITEDVEERMNERTKKKYTTSTQKPKSWWILNSREFACENVRTHKLTVTLRTLCE